MTFAKFNQYNVKPSIWQDNKHLGIKALSYLMRGPKYSYNMVSYISRIVRSI